MSMNKYLKRALVCLVLVTLLPAAAIAGCSRHPYADEDERVEFEYVAIDEDCHLTLYTYLYYCSSCGEYLGSFGPIEDVYEPHRFNSRGVCRDCGYTDKSHRLTPEQLEEQALSLGAAVVGRTLSILYEGNIYAQPGTYASVVGRAYKTETYTILDYTVTDYVHVWFRVSYAGGSAWISASLGEVNSTSRQTGDLSVYIGRTCVITARTSARVRSDANAGAPIVAYAKNGKRFTILDVKNADNGTPWYKIRVDGIEGWIASTMADVK